MSDTKYQIFISSTFADLVEERQRIARAILDMGHIPAGMEMFPAADVEQLTYIKKVIDECDYYVLVVGARYGSLDPEGISFTEREYDYAVGSAKTVLAFVHQNMDDIPLGKTDKDDAKFAKLMAFKEKVSNGRLVKFWRTPDELAAQAIIALNKAFAADPQVGWVRADQMPTASTMADVLRYREEIDRLQRELERLKTSSSPKFEDAADLTQSLKIAYSYYANQTKRNSSLTLTYADLLKLLGPTLHTPANIAGAMSALKTGLIERYNAPSYLLNIKQSDVQDGLLHLVATGHVNMWAGTLKDGSNSTGYQLTELGNKTWQEMSYVKKARAEVGAPDANDSSEGK
jgi:hypothetical protein